MKKIVNDIIPVEGYIAATFWPFVFVRKELKYRFDEVAERHENIHGRQQIEMLIVGIVLATGLYFVIGWWCLLALPIFFWWYLIEYVLRSIFGTGDAYRKILVEREAYANEHDMDYLKHRKPFAWLTYVNK